MEGSFSRSNIIGGTGISLTNSGVSDVVISTSVPSQTTTTQTTLDSNTAALEETIPSGIEGLRVDASFNQTTTIASNTTTRLVAILLDGDTELGKVTIFEKTGAIGTNDTITFDFLTRKVYNEKKWSVVSSSNQETSPRVNSFSWTTDNTADGLKIEFELPTTPSKPQFGSGGIFYATRFPAGHSQGGFNQEDIIVGEDLVKTEPNNHSVRLDVKGRIFRAAYNLSHNGTTALAVGDRFVRNLASYSSDGVWYISGRQATSGSQIPQGRVNQIVAAYSGSGDEVRAVKAIDTNKAVQPLASEIKSGETWSNITNGTDIYVDGNDNWKFTATETDWYFGYKENGDLIGDWQAVFNRRDVVARHIDVIGDTITPIGDRDSTVLGTFTLVTQENQLQAGRMYYNSGAGQMKIHLRDNVNLARNKAAAVKGIDFDFRSNASNFVEGVIRASALNGDVVTLTFNLNSRVVVGTPNDSVTVTVLRKNLNKSDIGFDHSAAADTHTLVSTKLYDDSFR